MLPGKRTDRRNKLLVRRASYQSWKPLICFQDCVREHFRLLMRREDSQAPFRIDLVPSTDEVNRYHPSQGRAVTAAEWRVDLNGTPRSAWNNSCWRVFYFSFLQVGYGYTSQDERDIQSAFFNHLRYLQMLWKSLSERDRVLDERRVQHNKAERKRTVSALFMNTTYV